MKVLCLVCGEGPVLWDDPEADYLTAPMTCFNCKYHYEEGFKTYHEINLELTNESKN